MKNPLLQQWGYQYFSCARIAKLKGESLFIVLVALFDITPRQCDKHLHLCKRVELDALGVQHDPHHSNRADSRRVSGDSRRVSGKRH